MPKRHSDDDEIWNQPGIGGDPDQPDRHKDRGLVNRIREHFWRAMDTVPLSVPRWTSIPRTNANIRMLLDGTKGQPPYTEDVIKDSFVFFHNVVDTVDIRDSCWDWYFAHRSRFLREALDARHGARPGEAVYKAGDIPGDKPPTVPKRRKVIRRIEP